MLRKFFNGMTRNRFPLPAFVLPAVLGAAGGAALSKVGSKGSGTGFTQVANRFGSLEKPLTDFFAERIGQPGPTFPGGKEAAIAPISNEEQKSLAFLNDFGESKTGTTFNNAKNQINQTLTNQFDPTTSPYYQAVKAESARNLSDTQKNIANNASGGGRFFSGARLATQGEAAADTKSQLDIILAGLADKERDRALSVIPQALQVDKTERDLPLEKATAFQSLGALPRNIDQAGRSFDVGQFQQSEVEYPLQIASMLSTLLTGNQPVISQNAPSGIDQLLGGAGSAAGSIGTALLMAKLLGPAAACWVAKEVFGSWEHPKTIATRHFVMNISPTWFKDFYVKHGEGIAEYISNKPILKLALRPMFEGFALIGQWCLNTRGDELWHRIR